MPDKRQTLLDRNDMLDPPNYKFKSRNPIWQDSPQLPVRLQLAQEQIITFKQYQHQKYHTKRERKSSRLWPTQGLV